MPDAPDELYDIGFCIAMNASADGDENLEELVWSFADYV